MPTLPRMVSSPNRRRKSNCTCLRVMLVSSDWSAPMTLMPIPAMLHEVLMLRPWGTSPTSCTRSVTCKRWGGAFVSCGCCHACWICFHACEMKHMHTHTQRSSHTPTPTHLQAHTCRLFPQPCRVIGGSVCPHPAPPTTHSSEFLAIKEGELYVVGDLTLGGCACEEGECGCGCPLESGQV